MVFRTSQPRRNIIINRGLFYKNSRFITLERGYTTSTEFMDWRKSIIEGKDDRKNGAIIILNEDNSQAARWDFFRAWPVSWEGPGLTAGAAETAIEKLELAVEWVEQGIIS